MSETTMPAVEVSQAHEGELVSYELAFHVLPTVAEGEVGSIVAQLKSIITSHEGVVTTEEAPERFELAYDIVKYLEGRNRKFSSAYFGWVRFTAPAASVESINQAVGGVKDILRHLIVKLSKAEEAHPFYFHEALDLPPVQTVELDEVVAEEGEEVEITDDVVVTAEESGAEVK